MRPSLPNNDSPNLQEIDLPELDTPPTTCAVCEGPLTLPHWVVGLARATPENGVPGAALDAQAVCSAQCLREYGEMELAAVSPYTEGSPPLRPPH